MDTAKPEYTGQGHPWSDFLHHRARVIDWLYAGGGNTQCRGNPAEIARVLSMTRDQVQLIMLRDRTI